MEQEDLRRVCAIIPALNEEQVIARVVGQLCATGIGRVLVVDNGSEDHTAAEARAAGAEVVSEPVRGYGQACFTGVTAARDQSPEVLVFLDGDGADQGDDVVQLVLPILQGEADLVIGARTLGAGRRALPPQQRMGNWVARVLLWWLYGATFSDIGSFRAIRADALYALDMRDRAFGWPIEMIVKSLRARLRIRELPVQVQRRVGRSKVSGTLRGTIRAAYGMFRHLFHYATWAEGEKTS